jgi:hypothetical protein
VSNLRSLLLGAALALAALGLGLAAYQSLGDASDARALRAELVTSQRHLATVEAASAMDRQARQLYDQLNKVGTDVAEAWQTATESAGASHGRAKAAAAWARVKALLSGPSAPAGVRVAIYEEPPEGSTESMKCLGWAEAGGVTTDGLDAWKGRVPAGLLASEFAKAETVDVSDLLWFAADGGGAEPSGPMRIHQHALYSHAYEDGDVSTMVIRGVEVSLPYDAPADLVVEV